jgi:hypothetical protein
MGGCGTGTKPGVRFLASGIILPPQLSDRSRGRAVVQDPAVVNGRLRSPDKTQSAYSGVRNQPEGVTHKEYGLWPPQSGDFRSQVIFMEVDIYPIQG